MKLIGAGLIIASVLLVSCATTHRTTQQTDPRKNDLSLAKKEVSIGFKFLKADKPSLAKKKFLEATTTAPDYPPVWYSLAYYYEAIGEKEIANRYYKKSIRTAEPKSSNMGDALNNYGTFLCRTGQPEKGCGALHASG